MKSIRLVTPLSLVLAATCVGGTALSVACGSDDDDTSTPDAGVYVDGGTMPGLPSGPTGTNAGEGGIDMTMYDSSTGDDTTGGGGGGEGGLTLFDSGPSTDAGADADAGDAGDSGEDAGDAGDAGDDAGDASTDGGDAGDGGVTIPAGSVMVLRVGDAAKPFATTSDTALFAAYIDSVVVSTGAIANFAAPASFSLEDSESAGGLQLSSDGKWLTAGAFGAAAGGTVTAATTPQVILSASATGTNNITTIPAANTSYAASGAEIRDVASTDGTSLWVSGTGNTAGVWYFQHGTTTTAHVASAPPQTRGIGIFGGQLYASGAPENAADGIFSVGSGVPVTAAQTTTNILPTGSPFGFVAFDTDTTAGVDLAYVADSVDGVVPYRLVTGTWTKGEARKLGPAVTAMGASWITGTVTAGAVQLYATTYGNTGSALYSLTDSVATPNLLATLVVAAPTGEVFRGVALPPSP